MRKTALDNLHCALSLAAQQAIFIVIGPVCLCLGVFNCLWVSLWVCYHDNSKLRASIFTKLGLWVKVDVGVVELRAQADASMSTSNNNVNSHYIL